MEITDIAKITITDEMITSARADQAFHNEVSVGSKTRADYNERDLVGSLAHQAVEQYFLLNIKPTDAYCTFRQVRLTHGDEMDIQYNVDNIDVKGTHGALDEQYFYNKEFLVYDDQLKDPKFEKITHFIFVLVDLKIHIAYVYGIISKKLFLIGCRPVQLNHANQGIRAYQLAPLHAYMYHKQNSIADFSGIMQVMEPNKPFVDTGAIPPDFDLAEYNRRMREKRLQIKKPI